MRSKSGTVRVEELTTKVPGEERGDVPRDVLHFITLNSNAQDCEEVRARLRACVSAIAGKGSGLIDSEDEDARMEEISFSIEVGKKQHRCHAHVVIKSHGKGKVAIRLSELRRIARDHGCPHMNCRYLKTRSSHTADEMRCVLRAYQSKDLEEARDLGATLAPAPAPAPARGEGSATRDSTPRRGERTQRSSSKAPEKERGKA